jgi:hypothetical protein
MRGLAVGLMLAMAFGCGDRGTPAPAADMPGAATPRQAVVGWIEARKAGAAARELRLVPPDDRRLWIGLAYLGLALGPTLTEVDRDGIMPRLAAVRRTHGFEITREDLAPFAAMPADTAPLRAMWDAKLAAVKLEGLLADLMTLGVTAQVPDGTIGEATMNGAARATVPVTSARGDDYPVITVQHDGRWFIDIAASIVANHGEPGSP